jgi:hypothetical protein
MIRFLAIMITLSLSKVLCSQDNIFTLSKTLEFANYQYSIGNCEAANYEYLRAVYLGDFDDSTTQFALSSALCANNLSLAEKLIYQDKDLKIVSEKSKSIYASLLLVNRNFEHYDSFIRSTKLLNPPSFEVLKYPSYLVLDNQWDRLNYFLSTDSVTSTDKTFYTSIYNDYNQIRFKKPWLSAIMSTVVPGSGKLYTGEWQDGLFSMLLIGVLSWQSARLLIKSDGKSVLGYTSAAIGGGLYFSNIFGSFRSAKNVNQRKLNKLYDKVDQHLLNSAL